jgi:transposase
MEATTIAVDLGKNVFELALADESWRVTERHRLSRARFARFFVGRPSCRVVMESCGTAHYWARRLIGAGHEVALLPAQYVRAYVRRNKTDRADASALIEAFRCSDIRPVPIKSVEHQQIQALHRLRSQWMHTRCARINTLRGVLREFGIVIPLGANLAKQRVAEALEDAENDLPAALRAPLADMLAEIRELELRVAQTERDLAQLALEDDVIRQLQTLPGIGLLGATALRAAVVDVDRFPSGRHFASWIGLTARESSSAGRRRLGGISKQGDVYLRTLLIHGARSVLLAAHVARKRERSLHRLQEWVLACEQRRGRNRAAVALANRIARIVWATWKHQRTFEGNWSVKLTRLPTRRCAA